jgi:hypothetical protein
MTKLSWNSFASSGRITSCFTAAVSAGIPRGPHLDSNGKKLPTPYGLVKEWANLNLAGDWTSTQIDGGFFIAVALDSDAQMIINEFRLVGATSLRIGGVIVQQLGYRDSDFATIATKIGYSVRNLSSDQSSR